jgi:hypothetical protein
MNPPAGRIQVGDRVEVPGGRRGKAVREALVHSNGAWRYTVTLDDGATSEYLDFELKRLEA